MQEQRNIHNSHHALVCLSKETGVITEQKIDAQKQKKIRENPSPVPTPTPQHNSSTPQSSHPPQFVLTT